MRFNIDVFELFVILEDLFLSQTSLHEKKLSIYVSSGVFLARGSTSLPLRSDGCDTGESVPVQSGSVGMEPVSGILAPVDHR